MDPNLHLTADTADSNVLDASGIREYQSIIGTVVISCRQGTFTAYLKIKILYDDGGGKYNSQEFKAFRQEHGIAREITVTDTPQQNSVV